MENEPLTGTTTKQANLVALFEQLPPLGSPEYLRLVSSATPADWPPEVLARAYRQLPLGSPAGRATLERLVARTQSGWVYLRVVARFVEQRFSKQATQDRAADSDDLMQDAALRILTVLHGPMGKYAEISWATFCRRQVSEAWRDRYGRRGKKLQALAEEIAPAQGEDEPDGVEALPEGASYWPQTWKTPGRIQRIETIARRVAASLPRRLEQEVAEVLWLDNRPKVSGHGTESGGPSLMQRFPGQSRDQLNRLIRRINAALAAALLADERLSLEWTKEELALLRKRQGKAT